MAEKTKETKKEEIFIPRGYAGDDPNLFVSVNGVNYLLPRGKTSLVPDFVAAEIRRSWGAADVQAENMASLQANE
jgi:hypothetical protein